MVRFADDFVMSFERMEDVDKVRRVIEKRFARYGLKINAEKTRLVRFKRPPRGGAGQGDKPGTFDFLGFTLYWGKARSGNNVVKKQTARKRFTRAVRAIKEWGWKNRHLSLKEQQCKLNEKLRGHDAYYGVTGNFRMLQCLRWEVAKTRRKWLQSRTLTNVMKPQLEEPDALIALVRFCGGRRPAFGPDGPIPDPKSEICLQRHRRTFPIPKNLC
jgi:hypothetical protein